MCKAYEHTALSEQPHHVDQGAQGWTVGQVEVIDKNHHATVERLHGRRRRDRLTNRGRRGDWGAECLTPQPIRRCPCRPKGSGT